MSDDEFEVQLRLEKEESEKKAKSNHGKTKTDEDGTVYEWDADKQAWFPKIDADFIAQYQMTYGNFSSDADKDKSADAPSVDDPKYKEWYYNWYNQAREENKVDNSEEGIQKQWEDYYKKCEEYYAENSSAANESEDGEKAYNDQENKEYWEKYYAYYYGKQGEQSATQESDKDQQQKGEEAEDKEKAAKKRKHEKKEAGWFEMEEKHNTSVYISGMPTDITEEEFEITMKKCGLIMFDPRTRKPKLKLYKNEDGSLKGDGLCCYIKSESVDLALQILDGYNLRGSTFAVKLAEFKMKGDFDPTKKKKKLTNKEKKRFKEHQEKLFGWKLEKLAKEREKHEKTVVIKNLFDPVDFEKNPGLIQKMREDLRKECNGYGDVKKVVVYDRHKEGIATVMFGEPAEADQCIQSMDKRYFKKKQVFVETWDGKAKFKVEESEEEKEKRLKEWERFLEAPNAAADAKKQTASKDNSDDACSSSSSASSTVPTDAVETDKTETIPSEPTKSEVTESQSDDSKPSSSTDDDTPSMQE